MNYHSDEWIYDRLAEHYKDVMRYYPKEQIIGVFYYGAGNYNLDTENSDVDTICLLAPKLDQVAGLTNLQSEIITRKNNELIFLYDIRHWFQHLREVDQLVKYWEPLFTKYSIVQSKYEQIWDRVLESAKELTHYSDWNFYKYIEQESAKLRREIIDFPHPQREYLIAKYGYDPKCLSYLAQHQIFLEDRLAGRSFSDGWSADYTPRLLELKTGTLDIRAAREMCKNLYKEITAKIPRVSRKENPEVDKMMNDFCIAFLREELRDEQ